MIICQIALTILAFILYFETHINEIAPWMAYIVLAFPATVNTFNAPARLSLIIYLVPREVFINAVGLSICSDTNRGDYWSSYCRTYDRMWGVQYIYLLNSLSFVALIITFG